jgi:hypothetical protein
VAFAPAQLVGLQTIVLRAVETIIRQRSCASEELNRASDRTVQCDRRLFRDGHRNRDTNDCESVRWEDDRWQASCCRERNAATTA